MMVNSAVLLAALAAVCDGTSSLWERPASGVSSGCSRCLELEEVFFFLVFLEEAWLSVCPLRCLNWASCKSKETELVSFPFLCDQKERWPIGDKKSV